ncbi:uncharacterized protein N7482_003927 [Penicillium canariense]|uniref:Uncharacterized protein n=1 Tax=Penicillium canariense TaxID=189055 RepID=A0A9W9I7N6_9EURO|nr:uncharacterized protein N7482_003927 [Penicillium canariense]KAJ5168333.1 hypothetical protein N7482_003927 [Penicillium canariense]
MWPCSYGGGRRFDKTPETLCAQLPAFHSRAGRGNQPGMACVVGRLLSVDNFLEMPHVPSQVPEEGSFVARYFVQDAPESFDATPEAPAAPKVWLTPYFSPAKVGGDPKLPRRAATRSADDAA